LPLQTQPDAQPVAFRRLALIGCLMGLLAAALFIVQPLSTLIVRYDVNIALRSIEGPAILTGKLSRQVGLFAASIVFVHCALGLLAAALAQAWGAAFAGLRHSTIQLTFLWIVALLAWVILANAAWFPLANSSSYYADLVRQVPAGRQLPAFAGMVLAALAAVPLVALGCRWFRSRNPVSRPVIATVVLLSAGSVMANVVGGGWTREEPSQQRPNVILVGVDSLRLDALQAFGGAGNTPNLDRFLQQSAVFSDTITPLSRTFPAWVSILTGQHPRTHGAVANLVARSTVDSANTLGNLLREHGYRAVMATDEVRFANIDESYGFDALITPQIGAADFLLGTLNDLPLSNLLSLTVAGKWLFPSNYANRAVATTYEPGIFIERLRSEVPAGRDPLFLAVHLAVAHFPYHTADTPPPPANLTEADLQVWQYTEGLRTADRMFGEVVDVLDDKGLLRNAIVVVLSDHGEALLQPGDRLVDPDGHRALGAERPIEVPYLGHGTSVLSPPQFEVLLALRGFGDAAASGDWPARGLHDDPASLEDIAPTLLDGLDLADQGGPFDGRSLLDSGRPSSVDPATRIRFTETDFNVPGMLAGVLNPTRIAQEGVKYYDIDPRSGWLYLKPAVMPDVFAMKQRAAMQGDWLLAALPTLDAGTRYLLINRRTRAGRLLTAPPAASDEPAADLWAALHARFPGELREPSQ